MQSVSITTNVVISNPAHGGVYSIPDYVIKFVSDLRQAGDFFLVLRFPPSNENDRLDLAEILLKVALNTTTLTHKGKLFVVDALIKIE